MNERTSEIVGRYYHAKADWDEALRRWLIENNLEYADQNVRAFCLIDVDGATKIDHLYADMQAAATYLKEEEIAASEKNTKATERYAAALEAQQRP